MSEKIFCSFQLGVCDKDKYDNLDADSSVYDILQEKPEPAQTNDFINNLYREQSHLFKTQGRETIKIAMVSDFHLDYGYTTGANADCGKPLCCRNDSGKPTKPEDAAGKWGDYRCDLNEVTFHNLMSFIKDDVKPDLVFWGGDSIPHNVDSLTFESNVEIMKNVTTEVQKGLEGLRIYPTIGNHDTYP